MITIPVYAQHLTFESRTKISDDNYPDENDEKKLLKSRVLDLMHAWSSPHEYRSAML